MSTSQQRNHTPGVMKFTNFGKPFLGHHYHTNNLSEPYPEERRRFLKNMSILHFLPPHYVPLG